MDGGRPARLASLGVVGLLLMTWVASAQPTHLHASTEPVDAQGACGIDDAPCASWSVQDPQPTSQHDWTTAVSAPDGKTVYLSATRFLGGGARMVAVDSTTGEIAWTAEEDGFAVHAAASPDGSLVYQAGEASTDLVTRAYHAGNGTLAWEARFDSGADDSNLFCGMDGACLAVDPGGAHVFTGGSSSHDDGATAARIVAHDAVDGTQAWTRALDVGARHDDVASLDALGGALFVAGEHTNASWTTGWTVARLDAATGATEWLIDGVGPDEACDGGARQVSAHADRVFVTGDLDCGDQDTAYAAALDAATGETVWERWFGQRASPRDVQVAGTALVVAGRDGHQDRIWALDAATGAMRWKDAFDFSFGAGWVALDVSSDGSRVAVASTQPGIGVESPLTFFEDYVTRVYDVGGTLRWEARHDHGRSDWLTDVTITDDDARVVSLGTVDEEIVSGWHTEAAAYPLDPDPSATANCLAKTGPKAKAQCSGEIDGQGYRVGA